MAKPEDVDIETLLAQATTPKETNTESLGHRDRDILFDQREDKRAKFKIAKDDKRLSGATGYRKGARLEINPENFTDTVNEKMKNQRIKRYGIILAGLAFLLVFAWGITNIFPSTNGSPNEKVVMPPLFIELYPDAPEPNISEMRLSFENETVKTTIGNNRGHSITVPGLAFEEVPNCSVIKPADFARCGLAKDAKDRTYSLWLLKDGVRSTLFSQAENLKKLEIPGAAAAASMTLSGFSAQPSPAIVIITPDAAGYMIILPTEASSNDINNLIENMKVD